jgi:signal transduction histidine kinase
MPERLPKDLNALYDIARAAGDGPYAHDAVLARIADRIGEVFGFSRVRLVGSTASPADEPALRAARAERAAAHRAGRVAVPLVESGRCTGFLVADCRPGQAPDASELQLLSAVGLLCGLFVARTDEYVALERSLEELRRLDELKDELVSVASHELRGPIAVVHGIAATLDERGDDLEPDKRGALRRTLVEQTARLRDLAEQLLDLSRLEAGRLHVESHRLQPRALVEALLPRIAGEHAEEVEVRIDPAAEVVCDENAFERVVGNLVMNALRHGQPPVRVCELEGGQDFRLAVEDSGRGVDPAFVPQLFDRFTRSAQSRERGGAGLGLAIARRYAEAVGGELRYEPAEPQGARFVFSLPA